MSRLFWMPRLRAQKSSSLCVFLFAFLCLGGCASPAPHGDYSAHLTAEDPHWQLPVDPKSGHLSQEFTLTEGNYLSFRLRDIKQEVIASVDFYDDDCAFGHEVRIRSHGEDRSVRQYSYLDIQIPWGESVLLDTSWHSGGGFVVTVNGQSRTVPLPAKPRFVQAYARAAQVDLPSIQYGPYTGTINH